MIHPAALKVPPPGRYIFKSLSKRKLVSCLDWLGEKLLKKKPVPVTWDRIGRLAVLRLDHLGDVLLMTPALEALRRALPKTQLDLVVGPWSREAAELSGLADRVLVFEAPWFSRPPRGDHWGGSQALAGFLREGKYDASIDFRGDFRHHLAAWRAGVPVRIGQTITGGGFLLSHPVEYDPRLHESEQNLSLLKQVGIGTGIDQPGAKLHPRPKDEQEAEEIIRSLGLTRPIVAIHPIPATPAKRWFPERWDELLSGLPEDFDIILIGAEKDRPYLEQIQKQCPRGTAVAAGLMGLPVLAALFKKSSLFIGVDSGPAHLAALVGVPVISLFSGTNSAERWGPRGERTILIQKKTECSPCELTICPFQNECMRRIEVGEVLKAVRGVLGT